MALPHDFRAAARRPMPVNGNGEPLQISGDKLQKNFEYLDQKDGLPDGKFGDMLYHDGKDWVPLSSPDTQFGYVNVMQNNPLGPEWVEYKEITVSICEDGTPTEYTILGIPIS